MPRRANPLLSGIYHSATVPVYALLGEARVCVRRIGKAGRRGSERTREIVSGLRLMNVDLVVARETDIDD